jgi:tetratricopeptide (TPR) repeat protein
VAGSFFAGQIGLDRDPSLAFINRARQSIARTGPTGERPLEARVRSLQATAGNAAVGQMLQRESAREAGGVAGEAGGAQMPAPAHSKLTYGSLGDEVRDLQARLNQANAAKPPLVIDGIYGRKTQGAVRAFQRARPPLTIDGDAGPETWAALDRAPGDEAGAGQAAGGSEATETVDPFEAGKAHFAAARYGQAYDEFTKAYEISGDPEHLFNRAQALRLLGGRREEAIALLEQQLRLDISDDGKTRVREKLDELRGPGRSTDEAANKTAVLDLHQKGAALYAKEDYARAYDEFSKAYEITRDAAMLWNRAQALRFLGGRRAEAIALYEQFVVADVPEDQKVAARKDINDLRGPGKAGDEAASKSAADALFQEGRKLYMEEHYALAYDAFSKAYEISGDPALLFNRAQAMRLRGGRRAEAITLFEQFLATNISEDDKKAGRAFLADLRGPGKAQAGGPGQPRQ